MDSINKKIAHELVKIKIKHEKLSILEAVIYCPLCSTTTTAFHKSSKDNKFLWNVSNFDVHLQIAHLDHAEYLESNPIMRQVKDQCHMTLSTVEHLNENTNLVDTKSGIETSKSQDFDWMKSIHNELGAESMVCFPDTIVEDVKDQSYSNILKTSSLGNTDYKPETSPKIINSKSFPDNQSENHVEIITNELLGKLKSIVNLAI